MFEHPVTTLFIIIMCYIAFYIWQNNIDPALITISYSDICVATPINPITVATGNHENFD